MLFFIPLKIIPNMKIFIKLNWPEIPLTAASFN